MRNIIYVMISLVSFSLWAKPPSLNSRMALLEKQLKELQAQQEEFKLTQQEPTAKVHSFLNDNLTFGGFLDTGYTVVSGEDTDFQAATTNIFGLNFAADFGNGFRFNSQFLTVLGVVGLNPHNNPNAPAPLPGKRTYSQVISTTLLTQGTLEYSASRALNIQGGLGYTPFGYSFQEREIVLFHRRGGPQMLRANNIVSPLWEGLHVFGSFSQGKDAWGYNAYTFSPPKKVNALGLGSRLWWSNDRKDIIAGVSGQVAKEPTETPETVGADLKMDFFPFSIRTEFLQKISNENPDPWSIYVEPSVFLYDEEILFFVFGDYLHNPTNKTTATVNDPISKWEYGAGVNWLPTSFTRIRLGVTYNDYVGKNARPNGQERDYLSLDLSAGVAF